MFMFCLYKMLGKFLDLELGTHLEEVTLSNPQILIPTLEAAFIKQ